MYTKNENNKSKLITTLAILITPSQIKRRIKTTKVEGKKKVNGALKNLQISHAVDTLSPKDEGSRPQYVNKDSEDDHHSATLTSLEKPLVLRQVDDVLGPSLEFEMCLSVIDMVVIKFILR